MKFNLSDTFWMRTIQAIVNDYINNFLDGFMIVWKFRKEVTYHCLCVPSNNRESKDFEENCKKIIPFVNEFGAEEQKKVKKYSKPKLTFTDERWLKKLDIDITTFQA